MKSLTLAGTIVLASLSSQAFAQQQAAPVRAPELALALEAAQAALATCASNNVQAAAAVVDAGGFQKVLLAADGIRGPSVEVAVKKAVTAATMKMATAELAEKMKTDKALEAKVNADKSLWARPGGFPFVVGGQVIGAIGVAGAQNLNGVAGGERDAVCSKAGHDKVAARMK
jgi:uncharacterized protein GlcG (DUF336 family)